jgi:competence protein ComEA
MLVAIGFRHHVAPAAAPSVKEVRMRRFYRLVMVGLLAGLMVGGGPAWASAGPVDINTATVEQLETIPGIGPAKAKAIVDYREGAPFADTDELQNVRGIGAKLYDRIKGHVSVAPRD